MRRNQLIIRNSAFQGAAGTAGIDGTNGANGTNGTNGTNANTVLDLTLGDSATLNNITALTAFSQQYAFPANYFTAGKAVRIRGSGIWSVGAGMSINFEPFFGGQTATLPAYALGGAASGVFYFDVLIVCRTTGGAGNFTLSGLISAATGDGATRATQAASIGFAQDTTAAINSGCYFAAATANNSATLKQLDVEALN